MGQEKINLYFRPVKLLGPQINHFLCIMKDNPRIIFMGTPDFAVPSLDILVSNGYNVVAVITATDKKGGRGGKRLIESAVKKYAVTKNIPVLQPSNLKAAAFIEELESYKADLQIVVAFRMLPEVVWAMPKLGTFNLHGSLLPKYRGAAPINWAIIRGDQTTGVTSFFIQKEIDTGDVILQEKLPIGPNESAGGLHDRMMCLGAHTVLKTVELIAAGKATTHKQDDQAATSAPKLFKENCQINFDQSSQKVHDFIRGLSPYPGAWGSMEGQAWKILKAEMEVKDHNLAVGTLVRAGKSLQVATQDGFIHILELQVPGKKRMATQDFLNGWSAEGGLFS